MKNKVFIALVFFASIVMGVVICKKKGIIVLGKNRKKNHEIDVMDDTTDKPIVTYIDLNQTKDNVSENISERHAVASDVIKEITANVFEDMSLNHKLNFDEIDSTLDDLLSEE